MNLFRFILVGVASLSFACAQGAKFRPVDAPETVPPQLAGLEYELVVDGHNLGDVKVWSEGANTKELNGKGRVVHVGLRIRNDHSSPLRFDPSRASIALITDDGELLELERPTSMRGRTTIPPGSIGRVQLEYRVPNRLDVYEIAGFEFNWAVIAEADTVATHSTTFVREDRDENRVSYGVGTRYYDPYFGSPYGYRMWPYY